MSAYPDLPPLRTRALMRDAAVLILLLLFAWFGTRVYHAVDELSSLGQGVTAAGLAVKSGLSSAAAAVSNVPIAGDAIAGALRGAGNDTGGSVAAAGRAGAQSAHHLALVLGLITWAAPSVLLLALVLPRRLAEARRLHDARALSRAGDAEDQRLLAVRAVLTLPNRTLCSYTSDPGGDLLAGRYERLAAAQLEASGVRAPVAPESSRVDGRDWGR